MPWSGGTFTLNQDFPADRDAGAPDHFIDADKVDDELQNIKAGLEACLHRGGQNVMTGSLDLDGQDLVLDADGDSILHATADDQIDLDIAGTNLLRATAASLALTGAMTISTTLGVTGALTATGGIIAGSNIDLDGQDLVLDADGDSILHATADDQIDMEIGATGLVQRWLLTGVEVTGTLTATGNIDSSSGTIGGMTSAEMDQVGNIDSVTISNAQWAGLGGASTFGMTLWDDADASAARTTLGVAIGSDVQAYDAGLASIAGLTTAADRMIYTTASDTYAVATLTAAGRALLDDADASAQRTTLGLGSIATQAASSVAITGGAIDGTVIGGSTAAAADFTTIDSTGAATLASVATGALTVYTAAPLIQFYNAAITDRFGYLYHAGLNSDFTLMNEETGALVFGTNAAEGMRLTSTGLGVGITSPDTALDVSGIIKTDDQITIEHAGLTFSKWLLQSVDTNDSDSSTGGVYLDHNTDAVGLVNSNVHSGWFADNGGHLFAITNFTERLRIDSSGDVGIGTTSPTEALDVNSDAIRVRTSQTPASASATGDAGMICWDSSYIYVCTAANTWKRASLATW